MFVCSWSGEKEDRRIGGGRPGGGRTGGQEDRRTNGHEFPCQKIFFSQGASAVFLTLWVIIFLPNLWNAPMAYWLALRSYKFDIILPLTNQIYLVCFIIRLKFTAMLATSVFFNGIELAQSGSLTKRDFLSSVFVFYNTCGISMTQFLFRLDFTECLLSCSFALSPLAAMPSTFPNRRNLHSVEKCFPMKNPNYITFFRR